MKFLKNNKYFILASLAPVLFLGFILVGKAKAAVTPPISCTWKVFDRCVGLTSNASYQGYPHYGQYGESYYDNIELGFENPPNENGWVWAIGATGATGNEQIKHAHESSAGAKDGFIEIIKKDLTDSDADEAYQWFVDGVPNANSCSVQVIGSICQKAGELVGTSHFVNTMLGLGGDNPAFGPIDDRALINIAAKRAVKGIDYARTHLDEWISLVEYYDSHGQVNWDIPGSAMESELVGACFPDELLSPHGLDVTPFVNCVPTERGDPLQPTKITDRFLRFYNADGSTAYTINKHCGNVTGTPDLRRPSGGFNVTPSGSTSLNDNENPTSVSFKGTITSDTFPLKNIEVKDVAYYISKYPYTGSNINVGSHSSLSFDFTNLADQSQILDLGSASLAGQSLDAGDRVCVSFTVHPQHGDVDSSGNVTSGADLSYNSSSWCDTVVNKPYVRIYGNDVFTGVSAGCAGWPVTNTDTSDLSKNDGGIYGFINGSDKGSASQLALMAYGYINGFASATLRSTIPMPPKGLDFANTGLSGSEAGGEFTVPHCPNDYYSESGTEWTTSIFNVAGEDGTYHYRETPARGPLHIKGQVERGKQIVINVDGDVIIDGNITFQGGNWVNNGDTSDTPSLIVAAKGNIYISNNVNQMDGAFVTQQNDANPNPDKTGYIYTCAKPGSTNLYDSGGLFNNCKNQLTVNGSLTAVKIKWLRTFGSLRNSGNPNCSNSGAQSTSGDCAAEVINYMPQTYLAPAADGSGGSNYDYDFFTILPPLL